MFPNKKIKASLLLFQLCCLASFAANPVHWPQSNEIKSIPLPPEGKRWILNAQFSDEFNGDRLDDSKWFDYHPAWIGREPGLFLPSQVSVSNGMLQLQGQKLSADTTVQAYGRPFHFNIACAAVVSKTQKAHYGYYECRFKANSTTLSTTFWLSSRGAEGRFDTKGRQPKKSEEGRFSQELDVCECIGRPGSFSGTNFCKGMNSNVHYWFTPTGGKQQDIRAKETRLYRPDGRIPSEDFNVYGCWWRNESSATFYLNNEQASNVEFVAAKTQKPFRFTEPMGVNMVLETYPQPWISLPTDEELSDSQKNISYYDWVRAYVLVDSEDASVGADHKGIFENHVHFLKRDAEMKKAKKRSLSFSIAYTADEDAQLSLDIYNTDGKKLSSKIFDVYSGYSNSVYVMPFQWEKKKTYTVVVSLLRKETSVSPVVLESDSYSFVIND